MATTAAMRKESALFACPKLSVSTGGADSVPEGDSPPSWPDSLSSSLGSSVDDGSVPVAVEEEVPVADSDSVSVSVSVPVAVLVADSVPVLVSLSLMGASSLITQAMRLVKFNIQEHSILPLGSSFYYRVDHIPTSWPASLQAAS